MTIRMKKMNAIFIIIIIITGMSSTSLLLPLAASQQSNLFFIQDELHDTHPYLNQSNNHILCQRKSSSTFVLNNDKETNKRTIYEPMAVYQLYNNSFSEDIYLCRLYHYLLFQHSEFYI